MTQATVGWVMDQDTSRRRVHVFLGDAGIALAVETGMRTPQVVILDVEGATYLQGLLGEAVKRVQAREGD